MHLACACIIPAIWEPKGNGPGLGEDYGKNSTSIAMRKMILVRAKAKVRVNAKGTGWE